MGLLSRYTKIFVWAALCLLAIASLSRAFADQHSVGKYEVQKGDNLWSISTEFLLGGLLYQIIFE